MADRGSSQLTAMGSRLGWRVCTCVALLAGLLHTTLSEHKKKIIVKVPTMIKHIHHDHYKPFHVHKVHGKKTKHHHHHEKHEDEGWEHETMTEKGKHNVHGSYSHLEPVLLHQDVEEHMQFLGGRGDNHEYGPGYEREQGQQYVQGYDHRHAYNNGYGNDYGHRYDQENRFDYGQAYRQENRWKSEGSLRKRRTKHNGKEYHNGNGRWAPVDMSGWTNDGFGKGENGGEEWINSNEDLAEFRGANEFSSGEGFYDNGHRKRRVKQLDWRNKNMNQEAEYDGWRPIAKFHGWRDMREMRQNVGGYSRDPYIHSGEDQARGSSEEMGNHAGGPLDKSHNKKKRRNKKKNDNKPKWSKQIKVTEPISEVQSEQLPQQPYHPQLYQQPYQVDRPAPIITHIPNQLIQDIQITPEPVQFPQPQSQSSSWSLPPQQNQQIHKRLPHLLPQQQQWPAKPPSAETWQAPATPKAQPQPTGQPQIVWSGHHLQLPQHSVWHVQQHTVHAGPVEAEPINHNSQPVLPTHPPPSLPLRPHPPSQLQQASTPVHHVLPPEWPVIQKTQQKHPVKQHWEQSVQTSGRNGPASSYKVEVTNYMDQNRSH